MAFQFSEQHIDRYWRDGYAVFEQIIPASLVAELRATCEQGAAIARKRNPQAQRFQPVAQYPIDQKPFEDYRDLPELRDAIHKLLSPRHTYGDLKQWVGVFIEPAEQPYCVAWHQDYRHFWPKSVEQVEKVRLDVDLFNQLNAALYRDDCTWVVPGSHLRGDLPSELAAFDGNPFRGPDLEGLSAIDRERVCLAYCRRMPGARQLHMEAGDVCVYRNTLWHMGNYVPYLKRNTLLDLIDTPKFVEFRKQIGQSLYAGETPTSGR